MLYGIDHDDGDAVGVDGNGSAKRGGAKISASMQRAHLLDREHFVVSLGDILKNGVTDKSESGRRRSFEFLQKLEGEEEGKLLEELLSRWDFTVQKKYKNWKKLQLRDRNKKKKRRKKRGKNTKSKKSKNQKQSKAKGVGAEAEPEDGHEAATAVTADHHGADTHSDTLPPPTSTNTDDGAQGND